MANLAWGGFTNGQIPRGSLVDIGGGKLLQADAARTWRQFSAAFDARWGDPLYLASYQDAYRDLAKQQKMYQDYLNRGKTPPIVSYPGYSNHGWGRAVDCSGYGALNSNRHIWMQQNGARFGWSWATGQASNESWHWEYVGAITTTAGDGGVTPIEPEEPPVRKTMATLYNRVLTATDLLSLSQQVKDQMADQGFTTPAAGNLFVLMGDAQVPLYTYDQNLANAWGDVHNAGITNGAAIAISVGTLNNFARLYTVAGSGGGGLTASQDAKLMSLPSTATVQDGLNSVVTLVNQHTTAEVDSIPSGGAGGNYTLSLEGQLPSVPGTVSLTGTATPES